MSILKLALGPLMKTSYYDVPQIKTKDVMTPGSCQHAVIMYLNKIKSGCVNYNYSNTDHLVFLPGMTERSSTLSATAFGLSEVALEG